MAVPQAVDRQPVNEVEVFFAFIVPCPRAPAPDNRQGKTYGGLHIIFFIHCLPVGHVATFPSEVILTSPPVSPLSFKREGGVGKRGASPLLNAPFMPVSSYRLRRARFR